MRNGLNPMRNAWFYGLNHGTAMRNTLCVLFLIVLSVWFTADYCVYYENMRNEKEKSFSAKWSFYASFSYKYHINESN